MKFLNFLHPDDIILVNPGSPSSKEFTRDMRSRKYDDIRLIDYNNKKYIRYKIENTFKWFSVEQIKKTKEYYLKVSIIDDKNDIEGIYVIDNREDKLNKLFK